jgi:hypothetical protein
LNELLQLEVHWIGNWFAHFMKGTPDKSHNCDTCGESIQDCVGHFGIIRFALPVFHIGFYKLMITVLQNICKVWAIEVDVFPSFGGRKNQAQFLEASSHPFSGWNREEKYPQEFEFAVQENLHLSSLRSFKRDGQKGWTFEDYS